MAIHWRLAVVARCALLATSAVHADIHHRLTGEVIPGTEGIESGPGVQRDHRELEYACLWDLDLVGANFEESNLASANFSKYDLTTANLRGTNLTGAVNEDAGRAIRSRSAELSSEVSCKSTSLWGINSCQRSNF